MNLEKPRVWPFHKLINNWVLLLSGHGQKNSIRTVQWWVHQHVSQLYWSAGITFQRWCFQIQERFLGILIASMADNNKMHQKYQYIWLTVPLRAARWFLGITYFRSCVAWNRILHNVSLFRMFTLAFCQ